MWHLPYKEKILDEPVRELFFYGVYHWCLQITHGMFEASRVENQMGGDDGDDGPHCWNDSFPKVFGSLDWKQQVAIVTDVTKALSDPEIEPPELYAWNEAAIWTMFRVVEGEIQCELDMDDGKDMYCVSKRYMVLNILKKLDVDEVTMDFPQSYEDYDFEDWSFAIEILSDRILHDRDFEDDMLFMFNNLDKPKRKEMYEIAAIKEGYFASYTKQHTEEEIQECFNYLKKQFHHFGDQYDELMKLKRKPQNENWVKEGS